MRFQFRTIILLFIFTLCSCTGGIYNDGIEQSYKNHFPSVTEGINQITRSFYYYNRSDWGVGAKHILVLQDTLHLLDKYVDSLKECSILTVNYMDSCLLFIPDRSIDGNKRIRPKLNPCNKNEFIPFPEFKELIPRINYKNMEEFIENYEFYIMEMESGKFLPERRLLYEIGLPEKWDNGYTKGFGINTSRNELLFWVDIW